MAPSTSVVDQARGGGHQFDEIVSTCHSISSVHEQQTNEAVSTERSEGMHTLEKVEIHQRGMHSIQSTQFEDSEQLKSAFAAYEANAAQKLAQENVIGVVNFDFGTPLPATG